MKDLKSMSTPELYSLWAFSKDMLAFWNTSTEPKIAKYYKTISDTIMDEINSRIDVLFPELAHLIE